jgi:hypothetical protein
MRFMAFKSLLAAVVLTTAALGTHAAKAETTLNIPFSFTVSGQTLPAGVYLVKNDVFHNVVVFRTKDATRTFSYVLRPGSATADTAHVALKFGTDGDSHILRWIEVGTKMTSRLDVVAASAAFDPARLSQGR